MIESTIDAYLALPVPVANGCGRRTTAGETIAAGYCVVHCAADAGWRPVA
jgi:hypothetical protein